jgi:putative acetyltransferase
VTAALREAAGAADLALARALFEEYAAWLGVDLCFQGFADELATLPGAYAAPRGLLLLAGEPGDAFGCVALRPLPGKGGAGVAAAVASDATPVPIGEVKRLYVQPRARGQRWGQRLAAALVEQARAIGYRELVLDTLDWMKPARALYAQLGFVDCPPYYDNPLAGVVYMRCVL